MGYQKSGFRIFGSLNREKSKRSLIESMASVGRAKGFIPSCTPQTRT